MSVSPSPASGLSGIQVDIVTPRKAAYSGRAGEVRIPAWEGQLGVLPGHDALLALLRAGVLLLVGGDGDKRFVVGRGFVEIGNDRVTILADLCERAEDVDKAAAQRDLDDALGKMVGLDMAGAEYLALEERVELARGRLAA